MAELKHVLNYSSDATKDLLANSSSLTLFAPVNQHIEHHDHHHGGHGDNMVGNTLSSGTEDTWLTLQSHIQAFETDSAYSMLGKGDDKDDEDDDKRRERRRKILTHIIDAVIRYHLVDSSESLTGRQLADNSSVATKLHVSWKKLNDAQPWRVKISQQLLPFPSIKLNYYSTVIKADVKAKNGLIHAVKYPLLPPPSLLQMLYFASPELSGTAAGLLKTGGHGYLALPKANATESSSADLDEQVKENAIDKIDLVQAEELIPAKQEGGMHKVRFANGGELSARAIILATGARWRNLGVPGEQDYRNKGVAYCPHCDGPLFKGKRIAVIGGGNSGVEAAIDLAKIVGRSVDGELVEVIEVGDHPWFVACQFHPEFTSTPRDGHGLFKGYVEAALAEQQAHKEA